MTAVVERTWWSRRRIAFAAAVTVFIALTATAVGLLGWVRSYAPLIVSGWGPPQPAFAVRPPPHAVDEGPGQAYVVRPGSVTVEYLLVGYGRWPVDIDAFSLGPARRGSFTLERVAVRDIGGDRFRTLPAHGWKAHFEHRGGAGGAHVRLTFRTRCAGQPGGTYSTPVTQLRVRYRYLRFFERSQDVPVPDSITLAC